MVLYVFVNIYIDKIGFFLIFIKKVMEISSKDELLFEIQQTEREKILMPQNNERVKRELILELKTGLGAEIRKNPGKAKLIKKTKRELFIIWLRNIFTRF
jgi:hypothetical protein